MAHRKIRKVQVILVAILLGFVYQEKQPAVPKGKVHKVEKEEPPKIKLEQLEGDLGLIKRGSQFQVIKWRKIIINGEEVGREQTIIALITVLDIHIGSKTAVCVASYELEEILPGMTVVLAPEVRKLVPPYIEKINVEPNQPSWGEIVELKADVVDLNKDISGKELRLRYKWETDKGILLTTESTDNKTRLICPYEKGKIKVKVTAIAIDEKGLEGKGEAVIETLGDSKLGEISTISVETSFGGNSRHFNKITDMAQDEQGFFYILDNETRRVMKLTKDFQLEWVSEAYEFNVNFSKISSTQGSIFLLDTITKSVKRYPSKQDLFAAPPEKTYGHGELKQPDKIALNNSQLFVYDAKTASIKIFDRESGGLLTMLGMKGKESLFKNVVAMTVKGDEIYCFDKADSKLKVFKDMKLDDKRSREMLKGEEIIGIAIAKENVFIGTKSKIFEIAKDADQRIPAGEWKEEFWRFSSIRLLFGHNELVALVDGDRLLRFSVPDYKAPDFKFTGQWGHNDLLSAELLSVNRHQQLALYCPNKKSILILDRNGWVMEAIDVSPWQGVKIKSIAISDSVSDFKLTKDNKPVNIITAEDGKTIYVISAKAENDKIIYTSTSYTGHGSGDFSSISSIAFGDLKSDRYGLYSFEHGGTVYFLEGTKWSRLGKIEKNGEFFLASTNHIYHIGSESLDVYSNELKLKNSAKITMPKITISAYDGIRGFFCLWEDGDFGYVNIDTAKIRLIGSMRATKKIQAMAMDSFSRLLILEKGTGRIFRLAIGRLG